MDERKEKHNNDHGTCPSRNVKQNRSTSEDVGGCICSHEDNSPQSEDKMPCHFLIRLHWLPLPQSSGAEPRVDHMVELYEGIKSYFTETACSQAESWASRSIMSRISSRRVCGVQFCPVYLSKVAPNIFPRERSRHCCGDRNFVLLPLRRPSCEP